MFCVVHAVCCSFFLCGVLRLRLKTLLKKAVHKYLYIPDSIFNNSTMFVHMMHYTDVLYRKGTTKRRVVLHADIFPVTTHL